MQIKNEEGKKRDEIIKQLRKKGKKKQQILEKKQRKRVEKRLMKAM